MDISKDYKNTKEIKVPTKLIDWIVGQGKACNIIKKAAKQRRNILLIGNPGTGKSMLAQAMAELMPVEELEDILVYANNMDENKPLIKVVPTYPKGITQANEPGHGRKIVEQERMKARLSMRGSSPLPFLILIPVILLLVLSFTGFLNETNKWIFSALILGLFIFAASWLFSSNLTRRMNPFESVEPKLIVDNTGKNSAPFVDATGAKAGSLFGDCKHDPLQSGGLGTPPHLRIESGMIHKSNKGVLFLDEVSTLTPKSQQDLLTAMQEKKFPITGQSEMSSGAIVRTEPVPCDFVLVAAGNVVDVQKMHPALRSRIRGYGYEVYMDDTMEDNEENRSKLVQFIAQEVTKDGKIPHFEKEAAEEIIEEARRKGGRKNKLTLKLRELGGIVRAAGDIAKDEKAEFVTREHILKARKIARTLEQQISQQLIEVKRDYSVFATTGYAVGKVNGLAVLGDAASGLVLPIVAEVTPASSKSEGRLIATGKLGKIAKEAVANVSAIIKKHMGKDVSLYDIHIQFLQTYEGVEGDSASISIAVAVISAMEEIAIDQSVAMTGSLSVRGEVLPVGGITAKIEAAVEAGAKKVIIPESNAQDVYVTKELLKKVEIIPVSNIVKVLEHALKEGKKKDSLISEIKKESS
ncbi:ATP-dependent protease LonB [Candidatus Micrarchaeota archaeon]|nr:ATP-dependent protease LonB [Candidatus Micrarchaeota archaeon]